ncbi:MAG: hypothetical protein RIS64_2744, partial [Bacteroidota bacterium]
SGRRGARGPQPPRFGLRARRAYGERASPRHAPPPGAPR